jgi:hypothetical protein
MGKYSLEAYERYQMVKCRPLQKKEAVQGAGISTFATVEIALGGEQPNLQGKTLLKVSVPDVALNAMAETEIHLRALAARYYRDPWVLGVTLVACGHEAMQRRLWETAAEAFAPKRYYVPVEDGAQLDYALKHGFAKGLLVTVGDNVYDACEAFAENNAQQLYKQMPVLVSIPKGQDVKQYVQGWHAMAVEGIEAPAGFCIALRRLNYPKALSSGGFAPMRFWWANKGPSYCHEKTEVRLRIEKDRQYTPIALGDHADMFHLADRVHNEIVRLPQAAPGVYRLEYALFTEDGEALVLAHDGRTADGYYYAGELTLDDTPRPEYETIWDDYFADGYYPLEDPKEPVG